MIYIDKKNNVYDEKPSNIETRPMMTIKEACDAWNVEGSWCRRIAPKVTGARQLIIHGRNTWVIPADAAKPTKDIKRVFTHAKN